MGTFYRVYRLNRSVDYSSSEPYWLWKGNVDDAIACCAECKLKQADNFCAYLEKHRHRIINYQYYQAEQICSIGSAAIESTVKQIDRRTKISGTQWNLDNVPQVLAHRCAYINGLIFACSIKTGMLPLRSHPLSKFSHSGIFAFLRV